MSPLPPWVENRLTKEPSIHPVQRRLVEALVESDRPVLSVGQLRSRVDLDADELTVRDRLEMLEELGILGAASYPDSVTLYYLNVPESDSVGPSSGSPRSVGTNPLDELSAKDFLTLRESDAIRTLVLAGYQLSLVLLTAGIVLSAFGIDGVIETGNDLGTAAMYLFTLCLLVHGAEWVVRRSRSDR